MEHVVENSVVMAVRFYPDSLEEVAAGRIAHGAVLDGVVRAEHADPKVHAGGGLASSINGDAVYSDVGLVDEYPQKDIGDDNFFIVVVRVSDGIPGVSRVSGPDAGVVVVFPVGASTDVNRISCPKGSVGFADGSPGGLETQPVILVVPVCPVHIVNIPGKKECGKQE